MKKIYLLIIVLMLSIFILAFHPLHINATSVNEITENSNTEPIEEETEASVASSGEGLGHPDNHGEEWYILSKTEPVFGNNKKIDYSKMSELLKYLKPGDIIYETNDSIIGDITGHIAIVYDILWDETYQQYYVSIIEAYTGGVGYGIMTPNRFKEKEVIIYRLNDASETQIQNALTWLQGRCEDNFRFHTHKYLNGLYEDGETYWYCAELVWAAFMRQEINLDSNDNSNGDSIVFPKELASSSHLTMILHYTDEDDEDKYDTNVDSDGATSHTYTCDGETYTEPHEFEAYNSCYEKCRMCDYKRQVRNHDYTYSYSPAGEEMHYASCECGAQIQTEHVFTPSGSMDICMLCFLSKAHIHSYTYTPAIMGRSHRKTCSCGDSTIEMCIGTTFPGSTSNCIKCGQVLNGGAITPLRDDENEDIYDEETE